MAASDTIFALSSGAPPAAIAVMRVSGPRAFAAGIALAGRLPAPRQAGVRRLRDVDGVPLDDALVLTFPGPASATGEDLLELHLHGGRAVVQAVTRALGEIAGLRSAEPGEFTRRALANGRIGLAEAEGLADLLAAESEAARRAALLATEGAISTLVAGWIARLVALSARTEAQIDFADEDDLPAEATELAAISAGAEVLAREWVEALARPAIERLRDGFRVVLAGPPNSGKSSLINALAEREVAIATPIAGTTRDRLEAPVLRDGVGYILTDTAGLHGRTSDPIEAIGMERTRAAMEAADLVVWLGDDLPPDPTMLAVHARCDQPGRGDAGNRLAVSVVSGVGVASLWEKLAARCGSLLPPPDVASFNARQRECLAAAQVELARAPHDDPLLLAEGLRRARLHLDALIGGAGVEDLLDDLFGRFCIGK